MVDTIDTQEGFFLCQGKKIYYRHYATKAAQGIPLICIHGGPGFSHYYLSPLFVLANERPVIFYDQLGCGVSERFDDLSRYTVSYFVHELKALLQNFGYDTCALLGHSWGSLIAAEYAAAHTGVKQLVLASPFLSASVWNVDIEKNLLSLSAEQQAAVATGKESDPQFIEAYTRYYHKHVYGSAAHDKDLATSGANANAEVYRAMWGANEFAITGTLQSYEGLEQLKQVSADTLLTCGEFDSASPRACKQISRYLRRASLKVFNNTAHFPHLERKGDYTSALRNFLNGKIRSGGIFSRIFSSNEAKW